MVKVFFASKNHTEEVATFKHEDMFKRCLPVLDKFARASKMRVGKTITEEVNSIETEFEEIKYN
jgi:molecular chaperone GrpE (heat shock protein)